MNDTTKQLLTTIAENQPKIKELGYNEGFSAGNEIYYNNGYNQGYTNGYRDGERKGTETGKLSEYNKLWDNCQQYGTRRNYKFGFAGWSWYNENFAPKYDIIMMDAMYAFQETTITDLKGCLAVKGVKIDTSRVKNFNQMFYAAQCKEIPELDMSSGTNFSNVFSYSKAERIDKIILNDSGEQSLYQAFTNMTKLKHIEFEGKIGKTISFSSSPLSVDSLKNIITHLKKGFGIETLALKSSCVTELESSGFTNEDKEWLAEKGIPYYEGLTWALVIDDLGWSLVLA